MYGYDTFGRLDSADYPSTRTGLTDQTLGYDAAGNRDDDPGSATVWSYDADNAIEASPSRVYTHDLDGNLSTITDGTNPLATLTWAVDNRLRSYEDTPGAMGPATGPGALATYYYDPFGRRILKDYDADGGGAGGTTSTFYVWDGGPAARGA